LYMQCRGVGTRTPSSRTFRRFRYSLWAQAKIEGDSVVLTSPEVPAPAAVRYAWAMNPIGTLYNKEGLPASPFRTDNW